MTAYFLQFILERSIFIKPKANLTYIVMRLFTLKNNLYLLLFSFILTTLSAQNNQDIWSKVSKKEASIGQKISRKTEPIKSVYYQLDINKLKNNLSRVSKSAGKAAKTNQIIQFPNNEGGFDEFKVQESSVLEASYQAKHPELRTYVGQNIKTPLSSRRQNRHKQPP